MFLQKSSQVCNKGVIMSKKSKLSEAYKKQMEYAANLPADAHLEQEANYEVTEDLIAFGV